MVWERRSSQRAGWVDLSVRRGRTKGWVWGGRTYERSARCTEAELKGLDLVSLENEVPGGKHTLGWVGCHFVVLRHWRAGFDKRSRRRLVLLGLGEKC